MGKYIIKRICLAILTIWVVATITFLLMNLVPGGPFLSDKAISPEAKAALNQMKLEIASELGMSNYQQVDKGNLTARENGYVGGYMTKKLVEMAEQQMAGKGQQ